MYVVSEVKEIYNNWCNSKNMVSHNLTKTKVLFSRSCVVKEDSVGMFMGAFNCLLHELEFYGRIYGTSKLLHIDFDGLGRAGVVWVEEVGIFTVAAYDSELVPENVGYEILLHAEQGAI